VAGRRPTGASSSPPGAGWRLPDRPQCGRSDCDRMMCSSRDCDGAGWGSTGGSVTV
jgi:hypothetical protein